MATKLALWSLTLLPGDKVPILIRNDFQVTNAALTDDLADPAGRSVVKVTYQPINPALLADDDSDDSEIDSDDEISFPDEDEFELDEVEGFKEVKKADAGAGAEADEEDDEEDNDEDMDDEDDEDEDDDDDFSDDEPEVTNVICALTAGKIEQVQLDLTFTEGDAVIFEVTGKNAVHLMGNYIRQPAAYDSDSDYDSEDDYDDYDGLYDDEDEDEDDEADASVGKITEITEKPTAAAAKPLKAAAADKPKKAATAAATPAAADKKRKADAIESPAAKAAAAPAAAAAGETLSKKQKKKLAQQAQNGAPAAAAPAAAPAKSQKRTLASGLIIEDTKVGDGQAAKRGKKLGMRYIGKLTNGKQFDANTSGAPFSFVLGRGEVIRGWDEGLEGMKVGGERRLTIPANLAYGKSKLPGIPANSTLNFDVKLVSIK